MKQYEVEVTQIIYVLVEAETDVEALTAAYAAAWETAPDFNEATIIDSWDCDD